MFYVIMDSPFSMHVLCSMLMSVPFIRRVFNGSANVARSGSCYWKTLSLQLSSAHSCLQNGVAPLNALCYNNVLVTVNSNAQVMT